MIKFLDLFVEKAELTYGSISFKPIEEVEKVVKTAISELLIISPFISRTALESVMQSVSDKSIRVQVLTRWRKLDVISGVSDIEVFKFLDEMGAEMFHHEKIHLKCIVADKKRAVIGSANLTNTGLGLNQDWNNVEVVAPVELNSEDFKSLEMLLADEYARRIDQDFYERMKALIAAHEDFKEKVLKFKEQYHAEMSKADGWMKFLKPAWNKERFMEQYWQRYTED